MQQKYKAKKLFKIKKHFFCYDTIESVKISYVTQAHSSKP